MRIYFPRLNQPASTAREPAPQENVQGGSETILLVEDEASVRTVARHLLEDLGYRVLCTASAAEALELAARHDRGIDLLLTDVVMPGTSGPDLAKQIQTILPDIKCLFMSGYAAETIARQGLLEEGVAFLAKPFTRPRIAARIREALDG